MEMSDNKVLHILGDTSINPIDTRISHTPKDGVWSGNRGQSKFYPCDKDSMDLLEKYGQKYIAYNLTAEPNLRPFEQVHVAIQDMSGDRNKNFQSAYKQLLKTEWAKQNNIKTVGECKLFLSKNNLTLHECSDVKTIRVVPREIHEMARHCGGVSELRAMEMGYDVEDGIIRNSAKAIKTAKTNLGKAGIYIEQNRVVNAGAEAVRDAESEIVYVGIQNIMAVINEEKTKEEALKDTAAATGVIVATGMADKLIFDGNGTATEIVGLAFVIKDSFMKYVNGQINEQQFVNEVTGKCIQDLAGKIAYAVTGGNVFAQMLASYATAVIYNEIQSILSDYKSINTMQEQYRARLSRISSQMIDELQSQRFYLKTVYTQNAVVWNAAMDEGFYYISEGARQGNMQIVSEGIEKILGLFDSEVRFKNVNEVRNFFNTKERVFRL